MKKYFLLLVGFVALPLIAAEKETITLKNYTNQLGIIGGLHNGLSYKGYLVDKHFAFSADAAYDVYFKSFDVLTNFMYKGQVYGGTTGNLYLYVGGGVSLGASLATLEHQVQFPTDYAPEDAVPLCMGLNAIVGVEWFFTHLPLSLSLDYRPGSKTMDLPKFKHATYGNYYDFNVGLHWYL